jgi:hypothetical protein
MKSTIGISIATVIRDYTYTAYLSRETGKLLRITAGCRTWRTFAEAEQHYGSEEKDWSDDQLEGRPYRWAARLEARRILDRLQTRVECRQFSIKTARKRNRK